MIDYVNVKIISPIHDTNEIKNGKETAPTGDRTRALTFQH